MHNLYQFASVVYPRNMFKYIVLSAVALAAVSAQYGAQAGGGGDDGQYQAQQSGDYYNQQPTRPPIQILSHKQALNHDGAFKYGFAAENGLQQGESILPDGSRTGGYRYVDAHGKTISVKYTAGKEGFRILEGAHIPQPTHPLPGPQPGYAQQAQQYRAPQAQVAPGQEDDGSYKPQLYERPQPQQYSAPLFRPQAPAVPQHAPPQYAQPRLTQAAIQPQYRPAPTQDYQEGPTAKPGTPNSFGTGYSFEFAG